MSAALVESVRELLQWRDNLAVARPFTVEIFDANTALNRAGHTLDLPAILAALTEAEALRAQVADSQAREVALREALRSLHSATDALMGDSDLEGDDSPEMLAMQSASAVLSAPTDTAALRAMLERVAEDAIDNKLSDMDVTHEWAINKAVDRVLGGS